MDDLSLLFIARHPHDASRIIEKYPRSDQAGLLGSLDISTASLLLCSMSPLESAGILILLEHDFALAVLEQLPAGVAAACLRRLNRTRREPLIAAAHGRAGLQALLRLLHYPPNVAGAIMDPGYPVLPHEMTIGSAISALRRAGTQPPNRVYLVDQSHVLTGYVELGDLLLGKGKTLLRDILRPCAHTLAAHTRLDTVKSSPGWQQGDRLPVIDSSGVLLGVLTAADLERALGGDEWSGGNETRDILLGLTETFINACTEFLSTGEKRR